MSKGNNEKQPNAESAAFRRENSMFNLTIYNNLGFATKKELFRQFFFTYYK